MAAPKIELVCDARNELGEGPLWDPEDQLLYWIDSKGPTVNRYDSRNGSMRTWRLWRVTGLGVRGLPETRYAG